MPVNPHEKAMQRALIQYRNPKNYDLVAEALKIAGRTDLIGFDRKCLIRPQFKKNEKDFQKDWNKNKERTGIKNSVKKDNDKKIEKQRVKPKKTIRNVHKKKG